MDSIRVGDKVVVTKRYDENRGDVGMVGIVDTVDYDGTCYVLFQDEDTGRYFKSWCRQVKRIGMEPWEGSSLKFRFV